MSIEFEESVEAEAIGSDDDKPAGSGHALAIIVPTAIGWPAVASAMLVPKLIADAGDNASLRFLDFFTANIRNPNPRAAYAVADRAARGDAHAPRLGLRREVLGRRYRTPSAKQHLAAIRMLFDWLIVGQIFAGPQSGRRGAGRNTLSRGSDREAVQFGHRGTRPRFSAIERHAAR
jgi:hypothetical protein